MVAAAQAEKEIQQPAEATQEEEEEQASTVGQPSPHPPARYDVTMRLPTLPQCRLRDITCPFASGAAELISSTCLRAFNCFLLQSLAVSVSIAAAAAQDLNCCCQCGFVQDSMLTQDARGAGSRHHHQAWHHQD